MTELALPQLWQAAVSAVLVLALFGLFLWRFARRPWGLLACLGALLVDQTAKYWLILALPQRGLVLWQGHLYLVLLVNPYQGFGSRFSELLLACLGGLSLSLVLYLRLERLHYRMSRWSEVAMGLLMGGLAAIMVDRLRLGGVIDFLQFGRHAYVYNLADLCVLVAMLMLGARGVLLLAEYAHHPLDGPLDIQPEP